MALENLLAGIKAEAQSGADRIVAEAQKEADRILQTARQQAESEAADLRLSKISQCQNKAEQQIARANLEARKKILNARQEAIEKIFDEALRELAQLPPGRYREWMHQQILNACESGDETLVVSKKDQSRLSEGWLKKINGELRKHHKNGAIKLQFEDTNFSGGFILIHPQYEVVVSFEEILRTMKGQIQSRIAEVLFGGKK